MLKPQPAPPRPLQAANQAPLRVKHPRGASRKRLTNARKAKRLSFHGKRLRKSRRTDGGHKAPRLSNTELDLQSVFVWGPERSHNANGCKKERGGGGSSTPKMASSPTAQTGAEPERLNQARVLRGHFQAASSVARQSQVHHGKRGGANNHTRDGFRR